ncbi:bifunctional aspartate kinase/homoserine dehydrogenase I [Flavobacterium silvaticum]|uniref:Bifunctional aspartate kinase/homoserine dehydrogenase I n=1 Tax=Flavobacterium silvaticum TaxID=1852020 RepID=A0A972FY04_9FLAO|nr:bifunctional aspartate kinase/homoserine dehydrogenase I [Flavobacterium silvaticum]NMH26916.1 bifunctional aspartate kinase/homoserine dehydrogenase I [Flavobacterium silvaticum]
MIVMKFGGTSVANAVNINAVKAIALKASQNGKIFVVASALSGITDQLLLASQLASAKNEEFRELLSQIEKRHLDLVRELLPLEIQSSVLSHIKRSLNQLETLLEGCFLLGEKTNRSADAILSFGELLSSYIVYEAIKSVSANVAYKDSRELIVTDANFGKATVDFEKTNQNIREYLSESNSPITIFPGFIASTTSGETTTLGRGGSDYTAAILGAGTSASLIEIWTDVNGMYTSNPKLVKQARTIDAISYHEAMELSHFGAKVLYPPTIQPALDAKIPIAIKNTFEPENPGTLIGGAIEGSGGPIKGISHMENITLLTLEGSGMIGVAGSSKRLFAVLSRHGINVVFITQASSEHSICIGISDSDAGIAESAVNNEFASEISANRISPCILEKGLCIVALVGEKMKSHQGLSGRMFSTLGRNNVNIRAIAQGASERNISVVIEKRDVNKALNSLHETFFEDNIRQINLFVIGVGNVGRRFMDQLKKQQQFLRSDRKINIRVIGISTSRKMVFEENGIDLEQWEMRLEAGNPADIQEMIETVKQLNLHNSVVVDITASSDVAGIYGAFLGKNIAVVTCNKIACSSEYQHYNFLKELSRQYNAPFLFETNVGAGLPIIDTLKNLVASGDKVHKIQAVLSGSLNFIFNNYDGSVPFADIVTEAGIQGFTEPDPRIDLSGLDVARKILILARESGNVMEIDDIERKDFLPEGALNAASVPDFFALISKDEKHFEAMVSKAKEFGSRLKYVAEFADGKASVGLQVIAPEHPFYHLEGKDNIVLFYTDRYFDQPLIIKGAGAGADVTASGIFADVIRVGNN